MKRLLYILLILALCVPAFGDRFGNAYHNIKIVDELGELVTDITSITILNPGSTSASPVIYKDRNATNIMVNPITTSSTNTTLSGGIVSWWGPSNWDFTLTDGTNVATNADHRDRTASDGTLVFPSYLTSISTTTYTDAQSATFGTDGDWVLRGGDVANQMSFTPLADNSNFIIGTNGTTLNSSFNVYMGTDVGLKIDSSGPTFTWDGGIANINVNSNFATNVNTGTSTGATNIGSSTSGAITIDTTSTYTLSSDAAHSTTTTDAGADITIDATLGSVIVDGGEAIATAVIVRAPAGGVDITAAATFDIDITATGGRVLVVASEAVANQFKVDTTGTVAGFAQVFETTDGGIQMNADGASNGDITLDAADILTLTSVDVKIFDGAATETWTIEGTSNGTDATVVFTDPTANITWTFPTGGADTVAIVASTLATNYPDIANSVTGGTNQLIFEGSDADTEETIITATDPTGDIIWTLADGGAQTVAFIPSTLATNFVDIVNSVWTGTNQLIFEGTDADTEETVLTVIDATADNTLTLADDSGGIGYIPTGSTTKDATDAAIPLTAAVVIGTSDATSSWSLPDGNPGQVLSIVIGTDGGTATLTPDSTTGDGWATMVFTNDGEGATFMFVDSTVGWAILGTFGITTNPLTTGE